MSCIFCKIVSGEIPSKKVYEDDNVLVFHDINPNAPVHVLVVPKKHIESIDALDERNIEQVNKVLLVIPKVAAQLGLVNGYRVITNCGSDGGQTVPHLHFHIIGGKKLSVKLN